MAVAVPIPNCLAILRQLVPWFRNRRTFSGAVVTRGRPACTLGLRHSAAPTEQGLAPRETQQADFDRPLGASLHL